MVCSICINLVKSKIMKKQILYLLVFFLLCSFRNIPIENSNFYGIKRNVAASILVVHNRSYSHTIYSASVVRTSSNGTPYTTVYTLNIHPGGQAQINLGNYTNYLTITLNLSSNFTGSLIDWHNDDIDDINTLMGCQNWVTSTSPSLYFYMYGVNNLYLRPGASC